MMNPASFRIPFLAWLFSCITIFGFSQKLTVVTSLKDTTACPHTSLIIPVRVANMISVDSFLLTLNYNLSSITYNTFQQVNSQLSGGTLHVTDAAGVLTISWKGINQVNILNDKIVDLIFQTKTGNSALTWDTIQPGKCLYLSNTNILPALFSSDTVTLFPLITLTLEQIDPTCAGSCNANFAAYASGGTPPFSYLWNSENAPFDSIQTGLCDGTNNIRITDANGCILDSNYVIVGLPATSVEVKLMPGDTIYMQNPTVSFSFENKSDVTIDDWWWSFGDGDTSRLREPVHTYVGIESFAEDKYTVTLWVKNGYGCDTLITKDLPIQESKVFIPGVFSPNAGVERNRTFKIVKKESHEDLTSEYLSLELQIYNRYGKSIYKSNDYKSDWDGNNLPDGVYYYMLFAHGFFRTDKYKGSVTILGGGR
jgi:hypothetical protein